MSWGRLGESDPSFMDRLFGGYQRQSNQLISTWILRGTSVEPESRLALPQRYPVVPMGGSEVGRQGPLVDSGAME